MISVIAWDTDSDVTCVQLICTVFSEFTRHHYLQHILGVANCAQLSNDSAVFRLCRAVTDREAR